jgi:hypothetical protein
MSSVQIEGHIDLHCHYGPDIVRIIPDGEYGVTALQAVTEARDNGCAALVLKAHDFPTAALANALNDAVDGIRVFGGICLDHQVGGLNPYAAEAALDLGAKIVWLPTVSVLPPRERPAPPIPMPSNPGLPREGIRVTDDDGELLPVVHDIFALVRDHGAILATGHISTPEHFEVARAFAKTGSLVVTHATEELAGPQLTQQECVELAELGAMIEFTALTCLPFGSSPGQPIEQLAAAVQAVGAEHVVLGSDLGFSRLTPHPAQGYLDYIERLYAAGASEAELEQMSVANPSRLLAIDA